MGPQFEFSARASLVRAPAETNTGPCATEQTSPLDHRIYGIFSTRDTRGLTSEYQRLTNLILIIPINLPVVVIITFLLLELHRLVVVLALLLDGSLVVLRRRQRGHPPRIHQTLLAVHTC